MNPKTIKLLAFGMIATSIGLFLFWTAFFTIGLAPDPMPECYLAYEHAFPFPDVILGIILLVAGIGLLRGRRWGAPLSIAASGAIVFLGLLDMCFNLQNGVYAVSVAELISNGFINLWCVVFGGLVCVIMTRDLSGTNPS